MKFIILLLRIIPKNLVSYLVGLLVRIKLPKPLALFAHRWFVHSFSIDMTEAEKPLKEYKSIEDVFTRKLKKSARPISQEPYCSPSDSILTTNRAIKDNQDVFEIKKTNYSVAELAGETLVSPAWISVFYLAPHNYHRVHSPLDGVVHWVKHIPGALWPVNPAFLKYLPTLFNKNERLVFKIETQNKGTVFLVMVGALNVGRMTTPLSKTIISNNKHFSKEFQERLIPPVVIRKGEEIGTFMMGSTVIMLFDQKALESLGALPTRKAEGNPVVVGESLL